MFFLIYLIQIKNFQIIKWFFSFKDLQRLHTHLLYNEIDHIVEDESNIATNEKFRQVKTWINIDKQ